MFRHNSKTITKINNWIQVLRYRWINSPKIISDSWSSFLRATRRTYVAFQKWKSAQLYILSFDNDTITSLRWSTLLPISGTLPREFWFCHWKIAKLCDLYPPSSIIFLINFDCNESSKYPSLLFYPPSSHPLPLLIV